MIDLSDVTGIDEFGDLTLQQVGSDTVITDGSGNSITLLGVDVSDLSADDFLF